MGFELVKNGFLPRKRWLLLLGALGFTGFGAYKVYNLPYVVERRERLLKLFDSFISLAEMVFASAAAVGIVSDDFKEFILSDSDQIPRSFKQISKMTVSDEFSDSLTRITGALCAGILSCYSQEFAGGIMDKLFSETGSGFAAVVVGSFARNLVLGFCSDWEEERRYKLDDSSINDHSFCKSNRKVLLWIDAVSNNSKFRELIGDCVKSFVGTAVTVYLDKTAHINTYDELLRGLSNPRHADQVKDMLSSVCSTGVDTFIRASHQVLTSDSATAAGPDSDGGERKAAATPLQTRRLKNRRRGFVSNRKLVFDTTGMVMYETVRAFMEFSVDKMKRSFEIMEEEIIERGFVAIRYINEKSSAVTAICVTFFLSILNSPWILIPY